jgi:hypothetical protein
MTIYDDPNRESVGLEPIWTGAGDEVQPVESAEVFDPYDYTVDEVLAYVAEHPEDTSAVLAAERAGKNRTTLVNALGV